MTARAPLQCPQKLLSRRAELYKHITCVVGKEWNVRRGGNVDELSGNCLLWSIFDALRSTGLSCESLIAQSRGLLGKRKLHLVVFNYNKCCAPMSLITSSLPGLMFKFGPEPEPESTSQWFRRDCSWKSSSRRSPTASPPIPSNGAQSWKTAAIRKLYIVMRLLLRMH